MPDEEEEPKFKKPWKPRKGYKGYEKGAKDKARERGRKLQELGIHATVGNRTPGHLRAMQKLKKELSNTWSQVFEHANRYRRMSEKQIEFFKRYAIYGRKNMAKAYIAAGYKAEDPEIAKKNAWILLKHPEAENLISAFEFEERAKMGLLVEDVANWFEKIANKAMEDGDYTNANRAMESYAKYLGMFLDRKEVTHRVVYSKADLDSRIAELQSVLNEERGNIAEQIRLN